MIKLHLLLKLLRKRIFQQLRQKLQKVKQNELVKMHNQLQLKMNLQINSNYLFLLNNHNNQLSRDKFH